MLVLPGDRIAKWSFNARVMDIAEPIANVHSRLFSHPMLTGSELLVKVKEMGHASKSDPVRACGYVSIKKDGNERLNFTAAPSPHTT